MFTLVDLDTFTEYGPFATHWEARQSAQESKFSSYAIWAGDDRVELVQRIKGRGVEPCFGFTG